MKTVRALILASPLLLAACGEGYELIKTDKMFPYGNQRTAGSGVAYVVAKMMPEKELNLKAVEPRSAPKPMAMQETKDMMGDMHEPAAQSAEKIFKDHQVK